MIAIYDFPLGELPVPDRIALKAEIENEVARYLEIPTDKVMPAFVMRDPDDPTRFKPWFKMEFNDTWSRDQRKEAAKIVASVLLNRCEHELFRVSIRGILATFNEETEYIKLTPDY